VVEVRLKDVAEHAGVSVRTVSNVVNGFAQVAPATRARVQASIDALGYRPNMAARTLRRGRTGLVALVVPGVDSPYFAELATHAFRLAEQRGLTVLVEQTDGDPARELALLQGRRNHLVDGVVFSPWTVPDDVLASHPRTLPMVLLGEHDDSTTWCRVAVDNIAAAREATQHLLSTGRRRIAAVGVNPGFAHATSRHRLLGYRAALEEAGHAVDEAREAPVDKFKREDGYRAMQRLLDAPEPPDAVFCFTDELALGALRAAAERGLDVPRDLAVVGFDDIEDGRFARPALTTVSPDKAGIARVALDLLQAQLDGGSTPESVTAEHHLVVRETTDG
jgi:DNA-binding LacI/PurR family transcriptional regulator